MSRPPPPASGPDPKYARLPTDAEVERTAEMLRQHGIEVVVVPSAEAACREALARIPPGSEVFDATSRTVEEIGLLKALAERSDVTLLKPRLRAMDRATQGDEMRRISQAPGLIVGSVHAVTMDGQVLVASMTGSQLGPYAHGAGRLIWIVGAQKIVPTLSEGLARLEHHSLPLEDARAQKAYGVHSSLNRILIVRRENQPGRATLILVRQKIGF